MSRPGNHDGGRFEVHCSGLIARALKQLQKRAKEQGRGEQLLSAIRGIWRHLSTDPLHFGEALYRLPALQLQVRHGAVRPLLVYFAVHDERPLVFIKGVTLLPERTNGAG
jgi:hypothetical protein